MIKPTKQSKNGDKIKKERVLTLGKLQEEPSVSFQIFLI